jgi:hypothetical protein
MMEVDNFRHSVKLSQKRNAVIFGAISCLNILPVKNFVVVEYTCEVAAE